MPQSSPLLVLVSGPPAAGKTTLARALSAQYHLPLFTKDMFKEMMYDNAPAPIDLPASRFYGRCSMETLRIITRELLVHGVSHIIEANFDPTLFSPVIRALEQTCTFRCLQILLTCHPTVLEQRFSHRSRSADYHQGHNIPALDVVDIMRPSFATNRQRPIEIGGELVVIDTSDTTTLSYEPAFRATGHLLGHTADKGE